MKRRSPLPWLVAFLAIAPLLLLAVDAHARPGGGSSYSGGSGGGGGGDALGAVVWFIFSDLPWPLKLIVVGAIVVVFVVSKVRRSGMQDWSSSAPATYTPQPRWNPPVHALSTRRRLEGLRNFDPDFSVILFEDFLYALYSTTKYSAAGRMDRLSAYLAPDVLARLASSPAAEVHTVIVGAVRFTDVRGMQSVQGQAEVDVEIESNVAMVPVAGQPERTFYLLERWTLTRRKDAHSRPPGRATILACPGCGAPLDAVVAGTCSHCKRVVGNGTFDWLVLRTEVARSEERGPMLTSTVEEQGNDLPTVVDPAAQGRLADLSRKDPSFRWDAFQQRVGLVFSEFQGAWANRDLARMRPFFTDALFDTERYWVEAYRAQALRNVTDRARIERLELARVASDKWFDAVTVRLYGTGLDYVVRDGDGKVVSGSTHKERRYTEYWTFIRGAGRTGPTRTAPECPSCGAPLSVGMAGDCRYCRAKVTTGEFDWVLSRIEQDEAYQG